jgi:hypothetical protein
VGRHSAWQDAGQTCEVSGHPLWSKPSSEDAAQSYYGVRSEVQMRCSDDDCFSRTGLL